MNYFDISKTALAAFRKTELLLILSFGHTILILCNILEHRKLCLNDYDKICSQWKEA